MAIKDDLLKHQIFLQRLGATNASLMRQHLNRGIKTALGSINRAGGFMTTLELRTLEKKLQTQFLKMVDSQLGLLEKSGEYEARFIGRVLEKNKIVVEAIIPTTSKAMIADTAIGLVSGRAPQTIEEVYNTFAFAKAKEITQAIADAGLTDDALANASLSLNQLKDGLYKAQTDTLAGTANTAVAGSIRSDSYTENNIKLVRWTNTLDNICDDCEAKDGNIYPADEVEDGQEHWNCKCVMEPINE